MEYQVFTLKWRPQNFDEVVGQDHIITNLKNAIIKKRIPHAFLFCGPHGVGKTSTARILAKSLNCNEGPTIKPCQKCVNCIEITQSRSIDVIEIDGASNRGIDEIRALRENVKFPPAKSRYKVYIIDEVHMLTPEAFNALLKTLEEPPDFVIFIFATTQPHKVLPTIISRCQRFPFRRISLNKIIEQLKKIASTQDVEIDEEVYFSIAKASYGSLRDAESILDQLISFKKDKLSYEDVMAVLGMLDIDILFSLTDRVIRKDPKGIIELLNKATAEGKDLGLLLSGLIEHFRNLLVVKVSKKDFGILDMPIELCKRLYQQSSYFSIEEIMHFFNILVNTQEMSKKIDSLSIPLEVGLIRLSYEKKVTFKDDIQPNETQTKEKYIPENSSMVKEDTKEQLTDLTNSKENVYGSSEVTLENIKERWSDFIETLKKIKMSVASYLNEGVVQEFKDNILTVSFAKNNTFHKEVLEQNHNKNLVEKTIEEIFKTKIKLNFIISKEETVRKDDESPFLKSIIETFNAKPLNRE